MGRQLPIKHGTLIIYMTKSKCNNASKNHKVFKTRMATFLLFLLANPSNCPCVQQFNIQTRYFFLLIKVLVLCFTSFVIIRFLVDKPSFRLLVKANKSFLMPYKNLQNVQTSAANHYSFGCVLGIMYM